MQLGKESNRCFNLGLVFHQQAAVPGVVEIASQQGEGHAKLRSFRSTHVVYALGIHKVIEIVFDNLPCEVEAPPFEVRVNGHGENILKSVVFRPVMVTVHGAILGIHAARPDH